MKTQSYKIYACMVLVFMTAAGIITVVSSGDTTPISLSDTAMSTVIGSAADMRCWNVCPGPVATETCDEGSGCRIHPDCPGAEFSVDFEATMCVTSNNFQHLCTAGTTEEVQCYNGYICQCGSYVLDCVKYTYGDEGVLAYKDC